MLLWIPSHMLVCFRMSKKEASLTTWKHLLRVGVVALAVALLSIYSSTVISWVLYVLNGLWPVVLSFVIAYAADIPLEFFERGYERVFHGELANKLKRPLCFVATLLIILGIIVLFFVFVVPELTNALGMLQTAVPVYLKDIQNWLDASSFANRFRTAFPDGFDPVIKMISNLDVGAMVMGLFTGGAGTAMNNIMAAASSLLGSVISLFIAAMLAFTWLFEKDTMGNQFGKLFIACGGERWRIDRLRHVLQVLDRSFHKYITGQFLGAVFEGFLCGIGMVVLDLPFAMSVGMLVGITALVPVFGPIVGMVLGLVIVLSESWVKALIFLVLIFLVQQLWQSVLYPKFVGTSVGLPGMWIMVAITVGGIFGLVGMTLSVPLAATIYQLLREKVEKYEIENGLAEPQSEHKKKHLHLPHRHKDHEDEKAAELPGGEKATEQTEGDSQPEAKSLG